VWENSRLISACPIIKTVINSQETFLYSSAITIYKQRFVTDGVFFISLQTIPYRMLQHAA